MIFPGNGRPLVIGHRGAPVRAPENTLASFEAAVAAGAGAVEIDVFAGLVVAHSEHEVPEDPLALDDALDFIQASGIGVLIDLKWPSIERDVAAAVRRHGLLERAFVSSTSVRALRRLAGHEPALLRSITYPNDRYRISRFTWPKPLTAGGAAALRAAMPLRAAVALAAGRAGVLTLHHRLVSAAVVRRVHARGGALVAWTVNEPEAVERLGALGVDGIVSDDPEMALRALGTLVAP